MLSQIYATTIKERNNFQPKEGEKIPSVIPSKQLSWLRPAEDYQSFNKQPVEPDVGTC